MMTPFQNPAMDISNKRPFIVFLMIYINCASGLAVPLPENLVVDILDGDVTVYWKHPVNVPVNFQYNVQMANYTDDWAKVDSCTGITKTYCYLNTLIHDYGTAYKVRVQLAIGNKVSAWTKKKFLPNTSKLRTPTFTLCPTSSTLTVQVHPKPILSKLFPYGVIYKIYLEQRGEDIKSTTAYMTDEEQGTKTFSSLRWRTEYCVSITVVGKGSLSISDVSSKQCVRLPEQEWYTIAVTCLSILGVLVCAAIITTILLCYLRRPEKTPAVLKSSVSGWLPLSVGEETMEVVTDKGWFLSSNRTEVKDCVKVPVARVTVTEDKSEEDRRTSMDSGFSMESNSAENSRDGSPTRQDDSGCGSLGGPESSICNQTEYPQQEEDTQINTAKKGVDSGVWPGPQLHSSRINMDGQDSGSLKEVVAGGNYRSQNSSTVHISEEELFEQMLRDSLLAEVVTGYRTGPQSCICSGAGQCTWCHKQGLYGTAVVKQYRAMCIGNGLQSSKSHCMNSCNGITSSNYSQKTQTDAIMGDDLNVTFMEMGQNFPMLTALTPLPVVEGGHDFNMNNVPLSLCDVQLTAE